jgi:3'-phosphoadenosine 5'-phosphosulfate sulfotransferase (PAPS reductase)/FAD synthetase
LSHDNVVDFRRVDVRAKVDEAFQIYDQGVEEHFTSTGHRIAAVCALFSGGNDSTTLTHLFKGKADYAVHVNTGIGVEQTRQFVRDTCAEWKLPLIEEHPPAGSTFEELVIDQGFPGPAQHWKMYQRLKERALRQVRRRFVKNPRRERVLFIAGRRRQESSRRAEIPESERVGSTVWISPFANWSTADLNAYRSKYDVPRNTVADLIHMSGECLCGAFAKAGELNEVAYWFPEVRDHIQALEAKVRAAGHPEQKCQWGWGAYRHIKPSRSGPMCSTCEVKMEEAA